MQHVITRQIGNLRGFSTDSIFIRPSNVAEMATNMQRAPDGTLQIRRGYQCQIAKIGGLGLGTFDDPSTDEIKTVTLSTDGFLYNKLQRQIYFYYNGQVTGAISNITNANPAAVESIAHGLQTGAQLIIRNVDGMADINNKMSTITVLDANNFTLDSVDSTSYGSYVSGGIWSIAFADDRYLTVSVFTDPRFISTNPGWSMAPWSITPWGAPSGESITCNIIVNRAAQVSAIQVNTNTVPVKFGHELAALDVIQFYSSDGVFNQRNVVSVTPTSITFDGYPVSFRNGTYLNQLFDIPFRKGFDVVSPFLISTFIDIITHPVTGVHGLQVSFNGVSNVPAAFIQIFEPMIVDSTNRFTLNYWYWYQINSTANPPFPGSANPRFQNSPDFENASMAVYDDVIYIANGWDYPQKFDGQTVYRAGMPAGVRPPEATDNTTYISQPFSSGNKYQYAISYEQIDNRGHIVEGEISEILEHEVIAGTAAINLTVINLRSTPGDNWNTNGAIADLVSPVEYGPDINGFYYELIRVNVGYTLKIGDSAYYADLTAGVISAPASNAFTIPVNSGHSIEVGDRVFFVDSSNNQISRIVAATTSNSITIRGEPVTVNPTDPTHSNIKAYLTSTVFGNIAIVNGIQNNVNTILVLNGHTVQVDDVIEFMDAFDDLQRRTVTAITTTSVTVDGIPVSVSNLILITSSNQRSEFIHLQRRSSNPPTLEANANLSNNLRINIYRTVQGESFDVNGKLYLLATIPNAAFGSTTQAFIDGLSDAELLASRPFVIPIEIPYPPPISKYLRAFGNQLFYAGGERGNPENSDRVFFSNGNAPETVPLAVNFFNVPNVDDDVTGIGVSGSTLITTKNHSLWAATGNFLSGQIEVVQIAPGTNIGCVAHATIASVGTLMYFLHTNGVYAITENQLFPTDSFGNPIPISLAIDVIFRETKFLPQTRYVLKRAVAVNYTKDNQYLLFLPCEDTQSSIRTANANSVLLCYDYQEKNWFPWDNMNAAGGMVIIDDELYFQERRFSGVDGNTANLYKQHRFYRLIDHADHAGPQRMEWRSSWEDLGQPEVRKKFCRCVLLMDRLSELFQFNNPVMNFSSYTNRIPNLQSTIANITQVDNIRNSSWSYSGWGWNYWSGYQDSFITVNLKGGTVAKSMQVGFAIKGINMDIKLAGFQLEIIPENRKTVVR